MAFYLDKQIIANSSAARSQYDAISLRRKAAAAADAIFGQQYGMQHNAAARLPQDAWREFDSRTKQLMTGDEGGVILNDLLPLAKSVPVGKIVSEYRKVSDSGNAQASISGQLAKNLDKAVYDYEGALVLIHDDAFGREWREIEAMRSEDFDGLVDDQANSVRAVRRSMINHIVNGVSGVKFKGASAFGIKTSPNTKSLDLDASGLNVDMTSSATTYAQAESVIVAALKALQGTANNVDMDVTFYFSSDIWFNMLRRGTSDTNFETFLDGLRRIPGVADIKRTNGTNVLSGNEFLAIALSDQFIQPVVGMAVTTTPIQRATPFSDYNLLTWGASGILIKADSAGRSGCLWARNIA